ncbi:hypothetical protein [Kitasatospora sp. NPDC056181]
MTPTVPAAVAAHTRRDLRAGAGAAEAGTAAQSGVAPVGGGGTGGGSHR